MAAPARRIQAPGLRWTAGKAWWVADAAARDAGFKPKRVDLNHLADKPDQLKAKCAVLQAEMRLWLTGYRHDSEPFDGSVRSMVAHYRSHPQSSWSALGPGAVRSYTTAANQLIAVVGERQVSDITGVDLKLWSKDWSRDGKNLARAVGMRTVLLGAASFGAMDRLAGCADLAVVIREAGGFPTRRPRDVVVTAPQVDALRRAAHAAGSPGRAMAYALVFELTLRLWDVIGQWWPERYGVVSDMAIAGLASYGRR